MHSTSDDGDRAGRLQKMFRFKRLFGDSPLKIKGKNITWLLINRVFNAFRLFYKIVIIRASLFLRHFISKEPLTLYKSRKCRRPRNITVPELVSELCVLTGLPTSFALVTCGSWFKMLPCSLQLRNVLYCQTGKSKAPQDFAALVAQGIERRFPKP